MNNQLVQLHTRTYNLIDRNVGVLEDHVPHSDDFCGPGLLVHDSPVSGVAPVGDAVGGDLVALGPVVMSLGGKRESEYFSCMSFIKPAAAITVQRCCHYNRVVCGLMREEVGGSERAAVGVGVGAVEDAPVELVHGQLGDGVIEGEVHDLGALLQGNVQRCHPGANTVGSHAHCMKEKKKGEKRAKGIRIHSLALRKGSCKKAHFQSFKRKKILYVGPIL